MEHNFCCLSGDDWDPNCIQNFCGKKDLGHNEYWCCQVNRLKIMASQGIDHWVLWNWGVFIVLAIDLNDGLD